MHEVDNDDVHVVVEVALSGKKKMEQKVEQLNKSFAVSCLRRFD